MRPAAEHASSTPPGTARFAVTRWSVVLAASRSDSVQARDALEQLCRAYWRPIYTFICHRGHNPQDAQDLTQEFFVRLLSKNYLGGVGPSKGRFRTFLLASLRHFLANEWDKANARKRGGGRVFVSLSEPVTGTSSAVEPVDNETAEVVFDRAWALALLDQALARLRQEHVGDGKAQFFDQLKSTLTGERTSLPYSSIGARLGLSEGAVKVAVHRLRQRYRQLLREEIAHTVSTPEQIEEELRALFAALS
jgi:RNA polymerase sigma-70 factor (ECF subfamily)